MESLIEIALIMVLPLALPMVTGLVSAIFFGFVHLFRNKYVVFVLTLMSFVFFYECVKWSLRFPLSMENDWFTRDVVPFLNVTFY